MAVNPVAVYQAWKHLKENWRPFLIAVGILAGSFILVFFFFWQSIMELLEPPASAIGLSCGINTASATTTATMANYSGHQMGIAAAVVNAGQKLNIPPEGILIALMVASDESGFNLWANSYAGHNVNISLTVPHDQVGNFENEATSVGIFQQQYWWAGPEHPLPGYPQGVQEIDLMNPDIASRLFYAALLKVPNWESTARSQPWTVAQTVQGSGDATGNNYAKEIPAAQQLLGKITPTLGLVASYTNSCDINSSSQGRPLAVPLPNPLPPIGGNVKWTAAQDLITRDPMASIFADGLRSSTWQGYNVTRDTGGGLAGFCEDLVWSATDFPFTSAGGPWPIDPVADWVNIGPKFGHPFGQVPVVGAAVVFKQGTSDDYGIGGHVAMVVAVNATTYSVAEMNNPFVVGGGYRVIDVRTIALDAQNHDPNALGFIMDGKPVASVAGAPTAQGELTPAQAVTNARLDLGTVAPEFLGTTKWDYPEAICDAMVASYYGFIASGETSAVVHWNDPLVVPLHKTDRNPPSGALIFWGKTATNPFGHVAISLGNGSMITNGAGSTGGRAGHAGIETMAWEDAGADRPPYLGWIPGDQANSFPHGTR